MANSNDNLLVQNTLNGDTESFRILVEQYKKPLINLAYNLTRNREDAEDIAQEAFMRAYEHLAQFDPKRSFFTWLYTICTNLSINKLKKKDYCLYEDDHPGIENEAAALNTGDLNTNVLSTSSFGQLADGEQKIEEKKNRKLLDKLMKGISDEYRTAVILRYQQELSYQEIAETLDISMSLAKVRVHRGIEKLRTILLRERKNVQ